MSDMRSRQGLRVVWSPSRSRRSTTATTANSQPRRQSGYHRDPPGQIDRALAATAHAGRSLRQRSSHRRWCSVSVHPETLVPCTSTSTPARSLQHRPGPPHG
jgi:hypothetical protein